MLGRPAMVSEFAKSRWSGFGRYTPLWQDRFGRNGFPSTWPAKIGMAAIAGGRESSASIPT